MQTQFRPFHAFHAVIETGTVTAAAQALGVSQPAVSNLLAQLERRTGLRLFERTRGRLVPTPEAEVLFREVDTVVRGLDHVMQAVTDLQNRRAGHLQVATNHALAFGFMPGLIADFSGPRPDMTISFQSNYSSKIQEWVAAGLFEIGVCEMPLVHDGLVHEAYVFETLCALPPGHPLSGLDAVTAADLDGVPMVAMGADHMVNRRLREAMQAAGATLRVRCHTDLFRNALNLVRQGIGVALLDPFTARGDPAGYELRPFRPAIALDIIVVTARARPMSAVGQAFLDVLRPRLSELAVPSGGGATGVR